MEKDDQEEKSGEYETAVAVDEVAKGGGEWCLTV